jgi:hypothetical protein
MAMIALITISTTSATWHQIQNGDIGDHCDSSEGPLGRRRRPV